MATPLRYTGRTPPPAPTRPGRQAWTLPSAFRMNTAPKPSEKRAAGQSLLPPAARGKTTAPVVQDDQSRTRRILEQMGVTDSTLGSRNIFDTQKGKSTATFGNAAFDNRPTIESRTGPGIKYTTPAKAKAATAPKLNDSALASRGATAPATKVVAQGSVYQGGGIQNGLAASVNSLNTSQEEAAALQEQWRQRLFGIAFSGEGNVGTDEGLMQLWQSQNALGLLNTSMGGKNTLGGGLDIAGIVRARGEYQTKAAEQFKKSQNEGSLRWAQQKLTQTSRSPWSLESSWDEDKRKKTNTRNMEATILGVSPASFWS